MNPNTTRASKFKNMFYFLINKQRKSLTFSICFEQNKLLPILNNNTHSEFNAVQVKKIKQKSIEKYVVKRE